MPPQVSTAEQLSDVVVRLSFLGPMDDRPRTYTYEPPPGVVRSNLTRAIHDVPVRDIRPVADQFTLDEHGFQFVRHRSDFRDFGDEAAIKAAYYAESARLIAGITRAKRVHIYDHTHRRHIPGAEDRRGGMRQPSWQVHVDQTVKSGPQRVREVLPDEADTLLDGRVEIINLWRPIRGPVLDAPLTVCDARSVAPDDLVATDLVYRDRVGEIYSVRHNARQRWHYVAGMMPDEALLLKCYDSKADGRARFAPHSAFLDPATPPGTPPRESIELRALVFGAP